MVTGLLQIFTWRNGRFSQNQCVAAAEPVEAKTVRSSPAVSSQISALITTIQQSNAHWLIVSNEVGLGLVPPYPIGRIYRDTLGRANQQLAQAADQVYFLVAGLPMVVKG